MAVARAVLPLNEDWWFNSRLPQTSESLLSAMLFFILTSQNAPELCLELAANLI